MLIISGSNVVTAKEKSQSLLLALRMQEVLKQKNVVSDVVDLRDYEIKICNMCEACSEGNGCVQDDDFNKLNDLWKKHSEVIMICPHYAGIPSKITAVCEKLQEISYLNYCQGKTLDSKKNALVIAHGGMTEDYEGIYTENLLKPLSNMLRSCGCKIHNDTIKKAMCFGVKKYYQEKDGNSLCFKKDDDEELREKIVDEAIGFLTNADKDH